MVIKNEILFKFKFLFLSIFIIQIFTFFNISFATSNIHFIKGKKYLENKDFEKAISEFEIVTKQDPYNLSAFVFLGLAYYAVKKYPEAETALRRALNLSDDPEIRYRLGNVYLVQGKWEEAIFEYKKTLEVNPSFLDAYGNIGLAYKAKGQIKEAIDAWKKMIDINPKSVWAYTNLGIVYAELGEFDKAALEFKKVIELDPDDDDARINLGNIYLSKKEYENALLEYEKALKINPQNVYAYNGLGVIYFYQDKLKLSKEAFSKAIELDKNNFIAHNNLGIIYELSNEFKKAQKEYETALKINPEYTKARINLGNLYLAAGKLDEAIKEFKYLVGKFPEDSLFYNLLGTAFLRAEKLDLAIEQFEKSLQINPKNSEVYANLAFAFYKKGFYDKAIVKARKSLEINPASESTRHLLGALLKKTRRLSLQEVEELLITHLKTGDNYLTQNLFNQAILEYQKARELNPDNPDIYLRLGKAYRAQGIIGEAINFLEKVLKIDPDNKEAKSILEEVLQEKGKSLAYIEKIDQAKISKEKMQIAVLKFNFHSKGGEMDISTYSKETTTLQDIFTDELIASLFQWRRFNLIEREKLEKVLAEHKLMLGGFIDENEAVEIGKVSEVDAVLMGSVFLKNNSVEVTARLVNLKGEILFSKNVQAKGENKIRDVIYQLAEEVSREIQLEGYVVALKDNRELIINLGKEDGLKPGEKLIVYRIEDVIRDPISGEVVGVDEDILGKIEVIRVDDRIAKARIIEQKIGRIKVRDKVRSEYK